MDVAPAAGAGASTGLAVSGAALVVLGFFLPWLDGTAEFAARDFSGFDLARLVRNFELVCLISLGDRPGRADCRRPLRDASAGGQRRPAGLDAGHSAQSGGDRPGRRGRLRSRHSGSGRRLERGLMDGPGRRPRRAEESASSFRLLVLPRSPSRRSSLSLGPRPDINRLDGPRKYGRPLSGLSAPRESQPSGILRPWR